MADASQRLEATIVRCRLIFSAAVACAVVLDPLQPALNPWPTPTSSLEPDFLGTILLHLLYSVAAYAVYRWRRIPPVQFTWITTSTDVLFAAAIAFVTEGRSSLFTPFFTFAIVQTGVRWGLRRTLIVTAASLVLWYAMILAWTPGGALFYVMRPVYLLIVGYLVGYLGEERLHLESEVRSLAAAEDRLRIARDLHDGCAQVLAGVNLQLESCRNLARAGRIDELLGDLSELQHSVNGEHDELRAYLRSLAGLSPSESSACASDPRIRVRVDLDAPGALVDQVLRIVREGVTNVRRHADANTATIGAASEADRVAISIEDDGRGFGEHAERPWSILSRVTELGGSLELGDADRAGARITISLPVA